MLRVFLLQDAITVVFSRSVIPLGSSFNPQPGPSTAAATDVYGSTVLHWQCSASTDGDGGYSMRRRDSAPTGQPPLPGRQWWVTTSILRFDPVVEWPNDLNCTVVVNAVVRAYDGIPLERATPAITLTVTTVPLEVYGGTVTSAIADAATDGLWTPQLGSEEAPECPADAHVSVEFNVGVDATELAKTMCLRRVNSTVCSIDALAVVQGSGASSIVVIFADGALAFDTAYNIVLPLASRATNLSGPTVTEQSVAVHGVRPFRFAFLDNFTVQIDSPQVQLFARHGLPDPLPAAMLLALQQSITVTPSLPHGGFAVTQVSKTSVLVVGDFTQATRFAFGIAASSVVRDNFGLALTHSNGAYSTADRGPFVQIPPGFGVVAGGTAIMPLRAIVRGRVTAPPTSDPQSPPCEGTRLRARSVSILELNTVAAIQLSGGCQNSTVVQAFWGGASGATITQRGPQSLSGAVETWVFPTDLISEGRVAFVVQDMVPAPWQHGHNCSSNTYSNQCSLFTASALEVLTFSTAQHILVWVTRADDASPVRDASVVLYNLHGHRVGSITSDATGLAAFTPPIQTAEYPPYGSFEFMVVAGHGSDTQIVQGSSGFATNVSEQLQVTTDLVFGRGLYRAGETIYVVVLVSVVTPLGQAVAVPDSWAVTLLSPWENDIRTTTRTALGTFSANVSIPANVQPGRYSLTSDVSGADSSGAAAYITVADPRLPSGTLNLTCQSGVFRPSANALPLLIATNTYLGTTANNATVDIAWTAKSLTNAAAPVFSGQGVVVLPVGAGKYVISMPPDTTKFLTATNDSFTLVVTATWLDAARDLLQQSLTLPIRESAWEIALSTTISPSSIVPGNPFAASVKLTAPGVGDGSPAISVSLGPCGDGPNDRSAVPAPAIVPLVLSESGIPGIFAASWVETLPTVGKFCLGAFSVDPHGIRVSASISLGLTAHEWQQSPLTGIPVMDPQIEGRSARQYRIGDKVTMSWQSPFKAATALLLWGHGAPGASLQSINTSFRYSLQSIKNQGLHNFTFVVGSECAHGCNAQLVVNSAIGSRANLISGVVPSKV
jgi:hypothetical protein